MKACSYSSARLAQLLELMPDGKSHVYMLYEIKFDTISKISDLLHILAVVSGENCQQAKGILQHVMVGYISVALKKVTCIIPS